MQDAFSTEFQPKRIIDNPSEDKLREWALEQGGILSEFGNLAVTTKVRNKIAKFTEVVMGEPDQEYAKLVHDILDYLRDKEVIKIDRVMCQKQQAEQKLVDKAAGTPILFGKSFVCIKPYVKGYEVNAQGMSKLNAVSINPH
jgi:hypothetical protein